MLQLTPCGGARAACGAEGGEPQVFESNPLLPYPSPTKGEGITGGAPRRLTTEAAI
jgi:hypothetical protein